MSVWRDGKEIALQPMIAEMPRNLEMASGEAPAPSPSSQPPAVLGLRLAPLTNDLRHQLGVPSGVKGAVVTNVAPDSPAADLIAPGDVIQAINQQPVTTPGDAVTKLQSAVKSGKVNVLIQQYTRNDEVNRRQ